MSQENSPEVLFDIETILSQFTTALVKSSTQLSDLFNTKEYKEKYPFAYHIPKMSISLNMELSYGQNKVKGIFTKSKTSKASTFQSSVSIDVISVPQVTGK